MTIVEKNKGKLIKKICGAGVPKEEYDALANQVAELNNQINNLNNNLVNKEEEINNLNNDLANKEEEINNGKELITDAIGDPLIGADSTFDVISDAILDSKKNNEYVIGARDALYNAMIEDGYDNANNKMTVDELIDLLDRSNIKIRDVKQIVCGKEHTFILKKDGSLWACGYNSYGELGTGDTTSQYIFTQVTTDVKQVACGDYCTVILKNDGSVWTCGQNDKGQLGLGTSDTNAHAFTQVATNVEQIACGRAHVFIIKTDGSAWACGDNSDGQLGLGDKANRTTFTQVITSSVKQIICGGSYTFILKNDSTVWSTGYNYYGELGLGNTTTKTTFTQVIIDNVKQISCGDAYTFILKNDGSVWACGQNGSGQLGLGDTTKRSTFTQVTENISNDVKQVICGYYHTFILKNDGSLWGTGANTYGQLGLNTNGSYASRTTFAQVTININNDVKQVACGNNFSYIIKNDGGVFSCGSNAYGQLGTGGNSNRKTFDDIDSSTLLTEHDIDRLALYNYLSSNDIEVTEDMDIRFMLYLLVNGNANNMILERKNNLGTVLIDEGVIVTEEDNIASLIIKTDEEFDRRNAEMAELENDINNGKQLIIDAIGDPSINADSTFDAISDAIIDSKRNNEYVAGAKDALYNMMIEDGYDNANNKMTVDELIGLLDRSGISAGDIKQIACGLDHTFILKNDGSLWSCGYNSYGQLGLGTNDYDNHSTLTQVTTNINNDVKQIDCGNHFAFIVKNDGSLWVCGSNDSGHLGLGDYTNRNIFTQVTTNINNDVKQVICGMKHTFIVKNDGTVWSCGVNYCGQLGLDDIEHYNTFTQVTTNINNDVKQISCGMNYTMILKNDGSLWACGYNADGELGLGTNDYDAHSTLTQVTTNINNDVKQVSCSHYGHTFIVKNDGSLWSCGYNGSGELGLGTNDYDAHSTLTQVTTNINNDVKQVYCGSQHTYIVKNDGSIWSCGSNSYGNLGLGDYDDRHTFTQVTTNINNDVKQIACDNSHVLIIKNDGTVWACGANYYGKLGLGTDDTNARNIFTNTNFATPIPEYDIDRLALYNYLLSNDIEVTKDMDIRFMLYLLVDNNANNIILERKNNLKSILINEGVSVADEDDMASLIAKLNEYLNSKK